LNRNGEDMAVHIRPRARRRYAPGLVTDLPVLVALVGCWLLVSVAWAHVAAGLALAGLIAGHLLTRRGLTARLLRRPRSVRQFGGAASTWALLAAAAAVLGTGLLRWAGVPPEATGHGGLGYVLLTAAVVHLWRVRRALRVRLRRRRTR
jgi:hypothetical protein